MTNTASKRSTLIPDITPERKSNGIKRPERIEPNQEYDPKLTDKNANTDDEKMKIAIENNRYSRTTLGTNKLQKAEFDALLEVLNEDYEFNYELLGKMLDDQVKVLTPDDRTTYYDILNRKKKRLDNQVKKDK